MAPPSFGTFPKIGFGCVTRPLLLTFPYFCSLKHLPFKDRGVLMENRLIGLPRLRQLKVTNTSCEIPKDFRGIIRRCYSRWVNISGNEYFPNNIFSQV